MKEIVIAADLGGTNLRMAGVDRDGNIFYRINRVTPRTECAEEIISLICEAAAECIENISQKMNVKILALAAALPAILNVEDGIILKAPNVPSLDGFLFSEALKNTLKLPCVLENDANAAAIGENWRGTSKNFNNSIMVTLGTGIGGGIIIDGRILRGTNGTAGEIGHICVEPFGTLCGCGSRGCVEQYASASAIVRLARELESVYPKSPLCEKFRFSALEVYEAGIDGDELALEVFRQQGFYLGIALAGLINVLNPEIIVIGGGAAEGWTLFAPAMVEQISRRSYREPAERAKMVRSALGDDAGILGAARLAFDKYSGF